MFRDHFTQLLSPLTGLVKSVGDTGSGLIATSLVLYDDTLDQQPDYLAADPECLFAIALDLMDALFKAQQPCLN